MQLGPAIRIALAVAGTVVALGATGYWMERQSTPLHEPGIPWGGGESPLATLEGEMVLVRGGTYRIGDESGHASGDAPIREVSLRPFYIDRHEVTNRQYARFVAATGYVTTAERQGGGWVYRSGSSDWEYVGRAHWRQPLGPGSTIEAALDHPVVLVSWDDALAYAEWAGRRLPSEAEWEVAARGAVSAGSAAAHRNPAEDGSANVWQGQWPRKNDLKDDFFYTAPAGSFAPNELDLYDMIGNVWEWTADPYEPADPSGELRVARGASWFCSPNYCGAYRPGFRGKSPASHAFNNVGFRCARDADPARDFQQPVI
ncbi:MAG TPA: formylglycine-generating enzyme family protein [Thermoanaerobaculia bacterium]|nr:formylglycine-generating enzyme family protein [Thermoanaerobaculia bacterium]